MSHNPLQTDGQGHDIGTQYRGVIFYHNSKQKEIAEKSKEKLNKEKFGGGIATAIEPAKEFYPAEDYHQRYLEKRGGVGYCHINVKEILRKVKGVKTLIS